MTHIASYCIPAQDFCIHESLSHIFIDKTVASAIFCALIYGFGLVPISVFTNACFAPHETLVCIDTSLEQNVGINVYLISMAWLMIRTYSVKYGLQTLFVE